MNRESNEKPGAADPRQVLETFRNSLLGLHKALVESERVQYEQAFGKIQSPNHFLQLLTSDPWFAWLSPLSKLIVSIDETLDAKEPLTNPRVDSVLKEASDLLRASENGAGFAKHYDEALQRDPDVVLAQARVARLHGWRKHKK